MSPDVSVVIIFLNAESFLAEAIDSVLAQTHMHWEILLVDDGSSDGSTALAQRYAARHGERIRLLEHPQHANLGMSASRNLGIEQARGRYLAFLDADDVYLPERLEQHVRILDRFPAVDMVQSDLIFWYSWESPDRRAADDRVRPFLSAGDRILMPPQGLLITLAAPLLSPGTCSITVRRDVALELGGFEPQFRSMYEDQVFLSKIYLEKTVYVLQAYLAKYRRHASSYVRQLKESGQFVEGLSNSATDAFHDWLLRYVRQRGPTHPLLSSALAEIEARRNARAPLVRTLIGSVFTTGKQVLKQLLPRPAYRRVLEWDWERQMRQTCRQYRALCARMEQASLPEASP